MIILEKNKHLPCFAHTLNLVATALLKSNNEVEAICDRVKSLVTFFKHSVVAADELRKYSTKKLIQNVATHWNSTFYMLERFIELSEGITLVLLKYPKAPLMLTASELQFIKELIEVLNPIEAATREISGEYYITGSKVIPLINSLKNRILNLREKLTSDVALQLLQFLSDNINLRFGTVEQINVLAISTILDPRFKRLHFNNPLAYSQAVNKIARQMKNMHKIKDTSERDMPNKENLEDTEFSKNIWSFHENLANKSRQVTENFDNIPTDLKHYLNQPTIELIEDPVHYWYDIYNSMYPSVATIAKQYLPVMATSVPSERFFSKAGNILTENRNRLTPEHLQQLLFLNSLEFNDWKIN